jgi:hypothetical protein
LEGKEAFSNPAKIARLNSRPVRASPPFDPVSALAVTPGPTPAPVWVPLYVQKFNKDQSLACKYER